MIRSIRTRAMVLALLAASSVAPAQAAVFEVTKLGDTADGACDRDCSLREAITAANNLDGPDVVLVIPGYYTLGRGSAGEDANDTGDLDVLDDLTLIGEGAPDTIISLSETDRVFHIAAGVEAEMRGVTVSGGKVSGSGGGILNLGRLTLEQTIVMGNKALAGGSGGGIRSDGPGASLTLVESAVHANLAEGTGGGILAGGTLSLANVTIAFNRAANGSGGGLYVLNDTAAEISNVTVADNTAQRGGGLYVESVPFLTGNYPQVRNSILARNIAPTHPDCSGSAVSLGYNLVGIGEGCIDFQASKHDLVGTPTAPLNPRLAGEEAFGRTRVPLAGSPAINAGNPAPPGSGGTSCEAYDQRGVQRTGRCDIGAVEVTTGCVEGFNNLCLNQGRFQVTAVWGTSQAGGSASAVELTPDSGYFWFFGPSNVELTVKVLDGCGTNGRYWVFLAGMTNLAATVTVTDTRTGAVKTYTNPQGRIFRTVTDTTAFGGCGL